YQENRAMPPQFAESVFEKWFAGSTGDPPVPSGDSPTGRGGTVRAIGHALFATLLAAGSVGESPTGAGGSPAPPIFKTGSETKMARKRRKKTQHLCLL